MSMEILCFIFWKKVFRAKHLRAADMKSYTEPVTKSLPAQYGVLRRAPRPNLSPQQEGPRWYQQNLSVLISNQQILLVSASFKSRQVPPLLV